MIYPAKKVFVILGSACNLACRYCIQHPVVHTPCPESVSPDVVRWLDDMAEKKKGPLEVCFYGGEPLLYFNAIREIVGLRRSRNLRYSLITNGRALTRDIVNWLNAYSVHVAVSWDGLHVKETRRYDVVEEKKELLLNVNDLSLTGVVTAENYPRDILKAMQKIDDGYFPLHRKHIGVNLDMIFGTCLPDPSLAEVDESKLHGQVMEILEEFDGYVRGGEADSCIIQWVTRYLETWLRLTGKDRNPYCQNGLGILNVDLAGNLYLCHNSRTIIGNIYEPTVHYVARVKDFGNLEERKTQCRACQAQNVCGLYCKLVPEEEGEEHWCRLRRAMLAPIEEYIEKNLAAFAEERSRE